MYARHERQQILEGLERGCLPRHDMCHTTDQMMPRYHVGLGAKLTTKPDAETGMVAVLMSASYAPSLVARATLSSR